MSTEGDAFFVKLFYSLPWLMRYPAWRASELCRRWNARGGLQHLILVVANHFEPSWMSDGRLLDPPSQLSRVEHWCEEARRTGRTVCDGDGIPFRHTYFYPAEQCYAPILERLAGLQAEGFGEVEIHLHHGVDGPDNVSNLRRTLEEFRDLLAERHRCLSRHDGVGHPMYAFVHGNLALANSAGGRWCGVDSEMQVLAQTGCYADLTLPSAPDRSQVPRINAVYQCGHSLDQRRPHRAGPDLRVGEAPHLPILITGPLVFDWRRRLHGVPVPRLDTGAVAANSPVCVERLHLWRGAQISVRGRPEWCFVKLFCHGFFPGDQENTIGAPMRRFLEDVLSLSQETGAFKVHFATAREAFNIAMAAIDGRDGDPGLYRDHRLRLIMKESLPLSAQRRS